MSEDLQRVIDAVEMWQTQKREVFKRKPFNEGASVASLEEFVSIQTGAARRLISVFAKQDPDFWDSLVEVATQASTMTAQRKTFVDGQDVTFQTGGQ
jgi:hypothetical protein